MITLVFSLLGLGRTLTHRTLLAGRFDWGVKTNHCWTFSINFWKEKVWVSHSNVLPYYLKWTFLLTIWIFTKGEGDGIKSRLSSWIFSTLPDLKEGNLWFLEVSRSKQEKWRRLEWKKLCHIVLTIFSLTKKMFIQGYSKFVKVIQAIKCSLPFPQIFTHCKHEMTI